MTNRLYEALGNLRDKLYDVIGYKPFPKGVVVCLSEDQKGEVVFPYGKMLDKLTEWSNNTRTRPKTSSKDITRKLK